MYQEIWLCYFRWVAREPPAFPSNLTKHQDGTGECPETLEGSRSSFYAVNAEIGEIVSSTFSAFSLAQRDLATNKNPIPFSYRQAGKQINRRRLEVQILRVRKPLEAPPERPLDSVEIDSHLAWPFAKRYSYMDVLDVGCTIKPPMYSLRAVSLAKWPNDERLRTSIWGETQVFFQRM